MHPILFHIGPLDVFSYGVMLSLGFALAVAVSFFNAKRHGIDPWVIIDMALWLFIAGLVSSRLLFVVMNWSYYSANPAKIVATWEGGVSFYGAIFGGLLVVLLYARRHKFSAARMADAVAPGLALAASVGRIGCALNGCCYGLPTDGFWGVFTRFAPGLRYPTQLFESTIYMAIFLFLLRWQKRHAKVPGQLFLTFVGLYLVGRSAVEFFREGERIYPWLSVTQAASIIIGLAVIVIYFYLGWRAKNGAAPTAPSDAAPGGDTPAQG